MDWLLKLLGVSSKNRKIAKKTSKAVNSLLQPKETTVPVTRAQTTKSNRNLTIDIDELPYDDYEIVGESNYQSALEKHAGPKTETGVDHSCEVLLICERANKFDKNAVRVEICGDIVGYLSRVDAESFREMLVEEDFRGAKVKAPAKINGGWRREDGEGHYGIVLDLE